MPNAEVTVWSIRRQSSLVSPFEVRNVVFFAHPGSRTCMWRRKARRSIGSQEPLPLDERRTKIGSVNLHGPNRHK